MGWLWENVKKINILVFGWLSCRRTEHCSGAGDGIGKVRENIKGNASVLYLDCDGGGGGYRTVSRFIEL